MECHTDQLPPMPAAGLIPRPASPEDEAFARLMDEIEVLAAVLEDVESEELHDQITMWIDYMIYRALYGEPNEPDGEPEARECRRLLVTHLDQLAWGAAGVEDDALARV